VRLVDSDGSQIGVKGRDEALEYAFSKNLDLVEIAPNADPPVCRVMDYGKYRYEQEQKAKTARKHQSQIHVKEIKMRPKIGVHDYETKKGHVMRLAEDVKDIGQIESPPLQDGRNMVMVLGPTKAAGQPVEAAQSA